MNSKLDDVIGHCESKFEKRIKCSSEQYDEDRYTSSPHNLGGRARFNFLFEAAVGRKLSGEHRERTLAIHLCTERVLRQSASILANRSQFYKVG